MSEKLTPEEVSTVSEAVAKLFPLKLHKWTQGDKHAFILARSEEEAAELLKRHLGQKKLLEKWGYSAWDAIAKCQGWEENTLGEKQKTYDNAETTANMLAYVLGEEWIYSEGGEDFIRELLEAQDED
jgi:hypothetical protein